jgi:uncharacterized membrane protein YdbT with pleckstrin-like domain
MVAPGHHPSYRRPVDLVGFPASLLSDDEDLVLDLRPHWMALIAPSVQALLILLALLLAFLYAPYSLGAWVYAVVLVGATAAFVNWPARGFVAWGTSHFVVTTDRVIRRTGLIAKQSIEISLERISDVRFHQSIVERLLGAGDLTIESAAGLLTFEDVDHPEQVQKTIFERKEANENQKKEETERAVRAGFWQPGSVADELAKLHRLHGLAVISDDEYRELKAKLFHRVRSI